LITSECYRSHENTQVGIDVASAPRQAGYIANYAENITGISLMHDEGTGGNLNGGYGIFPLFPLPPGFSALDNSSTTQIGIEDRKITRIEGSDST